MLIGHDFLEYVHGQFEKQHFVARYVTDVLT